MHMHGQKRKQMKKCQKRYSTTIDNSTWSRTKYLKVDDSCQLAFRFTATVNMGFHSISSTLNWSKLSKTHRLSSSFNQDLKLRPGSLGKLCEKVFAQLPIRRSIYCNNHVVYCIWVSLSLCLSI